MSRAIIGGLLIAATVAFATVPKDSELEQALKNDFEKNRVKTDSVISSFLQTSAIKGTSWLVSRGVTFHNWYLFKLATLKAKEIQMDLVALGIFGNWFILRKSIQ